MKKNKYSLKKVYESVFKLTKEDRQADINADFQRRILVRNPANAKTLKALYAASNDDDVINQTISTEIPGLGTFNLTPVQIGLIGCIDQYYYGDKQLALKLINVLKSGQSIENEETNQRVGLAASVSEAKENNSYSTSEDDEEKKLDKSRAKEFLKYCKKNKIIDKNYRIIKIHALSVDDFLISRATGFLFEIFLCYNISEKFSESQVNIEETESRLIEHASVKYVSSILKIVYDLFDFKSFDQSYNDTNHRQLYDKLIEKTINFFEKLIDPKVDGDDLFFEFLPAGYPIDLYIRSKKNNNDIMTALDLKSSANNRNTDVISASTEKVDEQIGYIIDEKKKLSIENTKDFTIGLLNINYFFDKNKININVDNDITCKYISYVNQYNYFYEKCLSSKTKDFKFTNDKFEIQPINLNNSSAYPVNYNKEKITSFEILDRLKVRAMNEFIKNSKQIIDYNIKDSGNSVNRFSSRFEFITGKEEKDLAEAKYVNLYKYFKNHPEYLVETYNKLFNEIKKTYLRQKTNFVYYNSALERIFNIIKEILSEKTELSKLIPQLSEEKLEQLQEDAEAVAVALEEQKINELVSWLLKNIDSNTTVRPAIIKKEITNDVKKPSNLGIYFSNNHSALAAAYKIFCEKVKKQYEKDVKQGDISEHLKEIKKRVYDEFLNKTYKIILSSIAQSFKSEIKKIEIDSPKEIAIGFIYFYLVESAKTKINNVDRVDWRAKFELEKKLNSIDIEKDKLDDVLRDALGKFISYEGGDAEKKNLLITVAKQLLVRGFGKKKIISDLVGLFLNKEEEGFSKSTISNYSASKSRFAERIRKHSENNTDFINLAISQYEEKKEIDEDRKSEVIKAIIDNVPGTTSKIYSDSKRENIRIDSTLETTAVNANDCVYIPGNVISERSSKKKTLREVYRYLF